MQSPRISAVCLLVAGLLLALGLFLWLDNTTVYVGASDIGEDGPAGEVGCTIAPWDAGFNDNREGPGGEHSAAYYDEVAADCYAVNTARFKAGAGSNILALLMGSIGLVVGIRSRGSLNHDAMTAVGADRVDRPYS